MEIHHLPDIVPRSGSCCWGLLSPWVFKVVTLKTKNSFLQGGEKTSCACLLHCYSPSHHKPSVSSLWFLRQPFGGIGAVFPRNSQVAKVPFPCMKSLFVFLKHQSGTEVETGMKQIGCSVCVCTLLSCKANGSVLEA